MSLDISLIATDKDGNEFDVWDTNITHNLTEMADAANLYKVMWRPQEIGVSKASEAIPFLLDGIEKLINNRESLEELNPSNGWGSYEGLLNCTTEYLYVCKKHPSARIEVSR